MAINTGMNQKELAEARIVIDDEVSAGKPRIRGTRVTVSDILLCIAEGMSHQDIMRNYRSLQPKDIQAAIAYSYCITDGIKMKIPSSFGANTIVEGDDQADYALTEEQENDKFSKVLEQQAQIQEEITKEKVAEIKAKKAKKSKAPEVDLRATPQKRPYDLLIDISGEISTQIFSDADQIEQALDMQLDNYIFETRADAKPWLAYSSRDGIEIDQAMKRNLLVTYRGLEGDIKEAVFEGYLTTDRQHKVFMQMDEESNPCGRAL